MKIVILVMSTIICFLIYLVIYFWCDRNFYRNISKIRSKCCDILYKDCIDNSMEWAKAYSELKEENKRLSELYNQLKRKENKNVK